MRDYFWNILFIYLIFGIIGLHLFRGLMENRCRLTPIPENGKWLVNENHLKLCGYADCPKG